MTPFSYARAGDTVVEAEVLAGFTGSSPLGRLVAAHLGHEVVCGDIDAERVEEEGVPPSQAEIAAVDAAAEAFGNTVGTVVAHDHRRSALVRLLATDRLEVDEACGHVARAGQGQRVRLGHRLAALELYRGELLPEGRPFLDVAAALVEAARGWA